MIISELIKNGKLELEKNMLPKKDAEYIFMLASEMDKTALIKNLDQQVSEDLECKFNNLLARRIKGEPVAYIRGSQEFWGLDFLLNNHTLIPRPDSETLVAAVLKYANDLMIDLIDLGTGSGCLLLSILSEKTQMTGVGVDLSEEAIDIARKNAKSLGLAARAVFYNQSWNDNIDNKFDIIISNPPYIKSNVISDLQREVRDFEPIRALDGGEDGLDCYRQIIEIIPKISKSNSLCFLEIGYDQEEEIIHLLKSAGFKNIKIEKDFANVSRVIIFKYSEQK